MVLLSMVSKILCLLFHLNCDAWDIQEVAKEWGGEGGGVHRYDMINYDNHELNYVMVVCDIKDSVFSSFLLFYTTQTERFVTKFCTFITTCTCIQLSLLIRSISEIVAARQGIEPRACSSASRALNHYTTAAPNLVA